MDDQMVYRDVHTSFNPRKALKAQVLMDIILEMILVSLQPSNTNESSNNKGSNVELILEKEGSLVIKVSLCFEFPTTNNFVEYESFIADLTLVVEMEAKTVKF